MERRYNLIISVRSNGTFLRIVWFSLWGKLGLFFNTANWGKTTSTHGPILFALSLRHKQPYKSFTWKSKAWKIFSILFDSYLQNPVVWSTSNKIKWVLWKLLWRPCTIEMSAVGNWYLLSVRIFDIYLFLSAVTVIYLTLSHPVIILSQCPLVLNVLTFSIKCSSTAA